MAKGLLVTYFIAVTICVISAYQKDCAVGPQYWCKSFQNAQDCGAVRHCTDTVWRDDPRHPALDTETKCDWCQKILQTTHRAIQNVEHNEELVRSTLINGCKLLPLEDISSKCSAMMENQHATVLSLMKNQRYDSVCHLMEICPSKTAPVHDNLESSSSTDEQSKMLCNVLVRATHELHSKHHKSQEEIRRFLKNDCRKLADSQLVHRCEDLVERRADQIHAHVASNIELSKVCDYIDHSTAVSAPQPVHCELCTFVLSIAKKMLDDEHTEDVVLLYINDQVCSRLPGSAEKNCKTMLDRNGRELLNNLRKGMQPMLLCTHFHVCLDAIVDQTSPIEKHEMRSFLRDQMCAQLGSLKSACEALVEKDGTRLLHVLANEINGDELCRMFGLCPTKSPLLVERSLQDDPSQCKRCVRDFTRRKHIAERLVNHSSEFLHHLCEQLPQKDDCINNVDSSVNELTTFIRSLNPRDICIQLNMCDQRSAHLIESIPVEHALEEEIVEYMKNDLCPRLGSLSSLCVQLAESEGKNLLSLVSKTLDPHHVCTVVDVCPPSSALQNCADKCQCCTDRMEGYQRQLAKFLRTMVASTRIMCDHVPGRDSCLKLADVFESNVQKVVARFNPKQTCELLHLCSLSPEKHRSDQCQTCRTEIDTREARFRTMINEATSALLALCTDQQCRMRVHSTQEELLAKVNTLNSQTLCQRLGYCIAENTWEPSATSLRLKNLLQHQTTTLDQRLEAHQICSEFGQWKDMCEHLFSSADAHRYANVYMSLLKNNPKLIDDDLREHMPSKVNADVCQSCKNAVESSKNYWSSALESVLNVLLRTCEYCSVKDQCRDYYNRRYNDFKSYLNNIDAEQFCQSLHLCSTSHVVVPVPEHSSSEETENESVDSNSNCILCEYMMNTLANYIHQQSTEEELERSLEKVCEQIPNNLREQCHQLVEDYGPPIIATLIREFDPSSLCRKLNLCRNAMRVDVSHLSKASAASCGVCDYVSTYIEFALKRDSSEKSLHRALATVCSHLSPERRAPCQSLVELFRPHIRDLKLGVGNNFCKQLTICQTPMSELKPAVRLNHIPARHEATVHSDNDDDEMKHVMMKNLDETPQCMLCHYVVSYLDAALKNNKSEQAVEEALARVCTILPRKERARCGEFVKTYGPVLAELIAEVADPRLVCRYLGMCQVVTPRVSKATAYSSHRHVRLPL